MAGRLADGVGARGGEGRGLGAGRVLPSAMRRITLITSLRVLGYVFNPISVFYCHDRAGALRAVLREASNTFGEHHSDLLAHAVRKVRRGEVHIAPGYDGVYGEIRLFTPEERLRLEGRKDF